VNRALIAIALFVIDGNDFLIELTHSFESRCIDVVTSKNTQVDVNTEEHNGSIYSRK